MIARAWTLSLVLLACCAPHSPTNEAVSPDPTPTVEVGVTAVPDYNRNEWGRWRDDDHDCQDTRQEVLIAESLEAVTLTEDGCKVLLGRWLCPLTGVTFTDPRVLDIDHMVPLRAAHDAGGHAWDRDRKRAYYNNQDYPNHLIAVDRSANRSKGSRSPQEWMPTNKAYHCEYLRSWVTIKKSWRLSMTCPDEATEIAQMMAESCGAP